MEKTTKVIANTSQLIQDTLRTINANIIMYKNDHLRMYKFNIILIYF